MGGSEYPVRSFDLCGPTWSPIRPRSRVAAACDAVQRFSQASGSLRTASIRHGQVAAGDLGEGGVLEHRAQRRADRDPDVAQALGRPGVVELLGRVLVDVGERPLDRADHVGDRDLGGVAGEPVAALGAAPRLDQARVLELEQDVLEELQRDPLGLGQPLALDRLAVVVRRRARAPRAPRSRPWLRSAPAYCRNSGQECRCRPLTSPLDDRPAEPLDRLRRPARARRRRPRGGRGRGDGDVADRPRRRRRASRRRAAVAEEVGIENVPAIEMSCVHQLLRGPPHLRLLGRPREDRPGLREGPAGARRPREGDHRQPQLPRGRGDVRGRGRQGRRRRRDRPPAHRQGRGRRPRSRARSSRSTWCPGAKAFVSRKWPTAEQAVELIHDAGGVAVVAHPYWDVKDPEQVRDLVESLVRDVGLDGIETFYPPHTAEQTKHCLELCEEFDLVPTASSDFHGPTHKTFQPLGRLRHLRARRAPGARDSPKP